MQRSWPFSYNRTLADSSRILRGGVSTGLRDAAWLIGISALTALCVAKLDFSLRIPGHAILRSIIPISFGLSLVPRRMSGFVLSAGAFGFMALFSLFGVGWPGFGAMTSMLMIGPLLDASTWNAKPGWGLYVRCGLAGLGANALAFCIRAGGKAAGLDAIGMRPLAQWYSYAAFTYLMCGLLAGLTCAAVWFHWSGRTPSQESDTA
ncbi:MAG: hypothetical protein R3C18_21595 [Planctomycetaceae bacterium]